MNEALTKLAAHLEASWNDTDEALFNQYVEFCDAHKDERFYVGGGYSVHAETKFLAGLSQHEAKACQWGAGWYKPENKRCAVKFAENLQARVESLVGEVTDWSTSSTENSLYSYLVKGSKGSVKVTQIYAGGYNIVRLHVRNIIKKIA